jgi:hypothetical protein
VPCCVVPCRAVLFDAVLHGPCCVLTLHGPCCVLTLHGPCRRGTIVVVHLLLFYVAAGLVDITMLLAW